MENCHERGHARPGRICALRLGGPGAPLGVLQPERTTAPDSCRVRARQLELGIVSVDVESTTVHHLAELTLALLLFADASTVPLAAGAPVTCRSTVALLGIGLPLSMVAGTVVAVALFPSLPLALAALVGASLAPTDAALSASVIADERLPARVRRVLNVESGLNDGIATPVVSFCIAAAATVLGIGEHHSGGGFGAVGELAIGIVVGVVAGVVGGSVVRVRGSGVGWNTVRGGWPRCRWRSSRSW